MLALRATARAAVPGIVHDSSGSGQTLFVEPFAVVDESNRLREAESAEREEVERILRALSRRIGEHEAALAALVESVARIDLALACGRLSRSWRGTTVEIAETVVLRGARHPLLDPTTAVPIELELGSLRALVISGPNTGGKTVALKTLGLAALLHQCGLRPPADHLELPVFDTVLADIGDEQSIAMSLSTFSGHVRNLVEILGSATGRSLVLLDEIAAGTDPVEGAALARALVGRLAGQARLTVVTSHYAELKEWASATEGVANAATGFDADTGAPLYRIALGRPGTSHALRIAGQLGLPDELVDAARTHVAPERLRVAELLAEAEAAESRAADERESASAERVAATRSRQEADARVAELESELERVRSSAQAERERAAAQAERELAGTRAELDALRAEIRAARGLERERRRASSPKALAKERERDRRLGAASERAARAGARAARAGRAAAGDHAARARRPRRRALARRARDDRRDREGRGGRHGSRRPPGPRAPRPAPTGSRRGRRRAAGACRHDPRAGADGRAGRARPARPDGPGGARGAPRVRGHGGARRAGRGARHPRPRDGRDPGGGARRARTPSARRLARVGLRRRRDDRAPRPLTAFAAGSPPGRNLGR